MTTATRKARLVHSPLYRFAVDGVTYTAEGERRSDSDTIAVTLHRGYPREAVLGWTEATRIPSQRVEDTIMEAARTLVPA